MRTLIGGTILGSEGFAFLIREVDVTFSACVRRFPELRLDDDSLALTGSASIAPVRLATWRVLDELPG
jgi:hypothetical protein